MVKDGSVKEFNIINDKLLFEGEYLNGKRNGKGKEYDDGYLIFDGEYLNGNKLSGKLYDIEANILLELRDGKGKEDYDNGTLKFERDYINFKRWNGKGYNYDGSEEFEIINGKGTGKEYGYFGELLFEGEYINGKRNGKGKEYYNNGKIKFKGEY